MRLFHFSDAPDIEVFEPRPVRVPAERARGQEWLNGPLVWAIDEPHQPMYLFPRDCPRILLWPTAATTQEDKNKWWGESSARMLAFIEAAWSDRLNRAHLFRYEFSCEGFEDLNDAGMWVARRPVRPRSVVRINDLPRRLVEHDVELRALDSLAALGDVWASSLHASGLRLRNAKGPFA